MITTSIENVIAKTLGHTNFNINYGSGDLTKDNFSIQNERGEEIILDRELIWLNYTTRVKKDEYNKQRAEELKGFVISNIFINENILTKMDLVYRYTPDNGKIRWININGDFVEFTKIDFKRIIGKSFKKIETIYFKYRTLKNNI